MFGATLCCAPIGMQDSMKLQEQQPASAAHADARARQRRRDGWATSVFVVYWTLVMALVLWTNLTPVSADGSIWDGMIRGMNERLILVCLGIWSVPCGIVMVLYWRAWCRPDAAHARGRA